MKQKLLTMMSKVKKKLSNFIILTKEIILREKLPILYIIGTTINGILLRILTLKEFFSFSALIADITVSLFFVSFYYLIKPKYRKVYLWFLIVLTTILCIANVVYYSYYDSFISVTFISFALTNTETGGSNVLGDLLKVRYFVMLWFPIFMAIAQHKIKKADRPILKREKRVIKTIYLWILLLGSVFLFSLKPIDYSRFYNQWNREYLVSRFGVYLYQANDVIKSIEPRMASLFGADKATKKVNDFYTERNNTEIKNEYSDIFKGKNVIAVHAESMQNINLSLSFNGVDVAPNLKRLSSEGLYFSNFYSQVSFGTSSDTEFTYATSLLPVSSGTVFINYSDGTYNTIYKALKEKGYYTFSMHANTGDFWNRNIMYKALGYDDFYEKSSYNIDEQIGFGLSDRSFITQSVEKIKKIASEHENFYGTIITLSNHTPFDEIESYGEYDVSKTIDGVKYDYLEGTKLGNYMKSVHYADQQIGLLIELLDKEGLLDNTVVVIYGDHDARISKSEWNLMYNYNPETNSALSEDDPNYKNIDYYWYEQNRKVPFIIWSKDENFKNNYAKEVTTVMGMYDASPTLGNMLGVYNKYALGTDIFNVKDDHLVPFSNGNYVTNYVYYSDSKGEYKALKDVPLDENYINDNKEKSEQLLDISDDIIIYNYMKRIESNDEYMEE